MEARKPGDGIAFLMGAEGPAWGFQDPLAVQTAELTPGSSGFFLWSTQGTEVRWEFREEAEETEERLGGDEEDAGCGCERGVDGAPETFEAALAEDTDGTYEVSFVEQAPLGPCQTDPNGGVVCGGGCQDAKIDAAECQLEEVELIHLWIECMRSPLDLDCSHLDYQISQKKTECRNLDRNRDRLCRED